MGTSTCCIPGRTAFTLAGQRLEIFFAPVTLKCIEYVQKSFYKWMVLKLSWDSVEREIPIFFNHCMIVQLVLDGCHCTYQGGWWWPCWLCWQWSLLCCLWLCIENTTCMDDLQLPGGTRENRQVQRWPGDLLTVRFVDFQGESFLSRQLIEIEITCNQYINYYNLRMFDIYSDQLWHFFQCFQAPQNGERQVCRSKMEPWPLWWRPTVAEPSQPTTPSIPTLRNRRRSKNGSSPRGKHICL